MLGCMHANRVSTMLTILLSAALASACANNRKGDDGQPTTQGEESPQDAGEAEAEAEAEGEAEAEDGGGKACTVDADCVPAECCHPTSCVAANQAPDCADVICTLECRPNTMDCGQGHCACQDGQCAAIIDAPSSAQ